MLGRVILGIAVSALLGGCENHAQEVHRDRCDEWRDAANHDHLRVANDGRSCSFRWVRRYGGGNQGINGGAIAEAPAHGTVRVTARDDGTYYVYRPASGYVGPDEFSISPGGSNGKDQTRVIDVEVVPP